MIQSFLADKKILLFLVVCFVLICAFTCARPIPPAGGPTDKTPPILLSVTPQSGSTQVPKNKEISFQFSEWLDARSIQKSILIFPPLRYGIKIKYNGKNVMVKPSEKFLDSTTYHITITTDLSDVHGVKIKTALSYLFSTGPHLDSGTLSGCVMLPPDSNPSIKIGLYRYQDTLSSDTILWGLPSYVTQIDSLCSFSVNCIPEALYRVIGFIDNNQDNSITIGKETCYVPQKKFISVSRNNQHIVLFKTASDTMVPAVQTIMALSPVLLKGTWNHWSKSETFPTMQKTWSLYSKEFKMAVPITQYQQVSESPLFYLHLKDSLKGGLHQLSYMQSHRFRRLPDTVYTSRDTIEFNAVVFPDTTRTRLLSIEPQPPLFLQDTTLILSWSHPVRSRIASWYIIDTAFQDTLLCSFDTALSLKTEITIAHRLKPDRTYHLFIPVSYFISMNNQTIIGTTKNNVPGNAVSHYFQTVTGKELCISLTGSSDCIDASAPLQWILYPFSMQKKVVAVAKNGIFRFDSIPSFKGTLSCFVDLNGNKQFDEGNLFPWIPTEPYFYFSDTIETRARWDIENIKIKTCPPCLK